ncbi:23S rRNA m(5)U-1939 methyltransferase [Gibbsiella quercinecans]|uniref:23S rRNA (uracil(1939)-C(5))-methyltransferase RlmD n=1 Tax=Gibbsiella quercinecans TaxID=929813 RepID=A0A250AZM1_9GAMM|nr:23S rRNA (uracil(1939)-C(5))-methyltransferase RlmD [Gibbsiella quercinecans]ATA19354.1 23S rRNA methyltransferase [Gibbsiella quercinecans]RLM11457.1 23S rRNA (uracil(1939)-C(5))-methyltransferase [Gibbsiella quercinecans]RLM13834.1 23S rRNA (uracil(1939)-C(5))-methyltransferase [Gibbsiella quercinecans]RLM15615.1 23S rRNA (uracil(1939)-C(5))-methyltransferase [Gibbsiella quercinecans]TCT90230.1 23S rRNA m(5)U-1939 methyltransferase [Gibbsiella quercinecans]
MAQFYSPKRRVTTRQASQILTVAVADLDPFGQGVARHNGKAVFVPGVLPGEQAEIQLTEDKRQFAKGRLKKLLNRSPQRVEPRCPHFGVCGGCQQQHADEALQQQSKAAALQRLIGRETGVAVQPEAVIAGPAYGYRRRARLGLAWQPRQQQLQMGFRQAASNELVNIRQCPVLVPELEQLLAPLYRCLAGLDAARHLGHAELVQADNGSVLVLRCMAVLQEKDRQALLAFARQNALTLYLAPDSERLDKLCGEAPYYQVDGLRLTFSPRDFIQVNDAVNQQMVAQAMAWLDIQPTDRVLDLFCGMGNFTLPLARRARAVVGIEGVATLVANGQYNAHQNSLENVAFFHENLEADIEQQPWAAQGFDKVMLDPARAGAAGVMSHIVKLAPERVVYVSCNPATLARDSKVLLDAGYRLARVRMLDMFPHTGHLESMALFINGKTPAAAAK